MPHASAQFDTPSAARLHTPDFEASPTKIPNEAIFSANPYQIQPLVPFGYEPSAPPTPGVLPSWEFPPAAHFALFSHPFAPPLHPLDE
jgi:hypothetical protein